MKKQKIAIKILLFSAILILSSCGKDKTIDDANIKIGTQIWMVKNLDVTTYRNGDSIPHVQDATEWAKLKTGAWCYYKNNPENGATYGKLYNWYAVNDPRGLAPTGYHVPSKKEWITLFDYLGGANVAGAKMKSTTYWIEGNGTNTSGFTGLPGGAICGYGTYARLGGFGRWWSSTENGNSATLLMLHYFGGSAGMYDYDKRSGYSVRCLKNYSN